MKRRLTIKRNTLKNGLLHYYALDHNSNDSVGGAHGVDTNVVYSSYAGMNLAYFNGSSHIQLSSVIPSGRKSMTINFFVKANSQDSCTVLGQGKQGYNMLLVTFRLDQFMLLSSYAGITNFPYSGNLMMITILIPENSNSNDIKVFVNALSINVAWNKTTTIEVSNLETYIGTYLWSDGVFYERMRGYIGRLSIYNRTLTNSEISQLYKKNGEPI